MKTNLNRYSLTEIFKQSAKAYSEAFPSFLKKLVIVSTEEVIYVSPDMVKHFSKYPNNLEKLIKRNAKHIKENDLHAFVYPAEEMEGSKKEFTSLSIAMGKINTPYPAEKHGQEISHILFFDHEMGHLIAGRDKNLNFHQGECIADAFCLMMHIKRLGNRRRIFAAVAFANASHPILTGSPKHYTSQAVFAVEKLSKEIDINKLSLKDIAWYAKRIGTKYALPQKTLDKINEAYKYPRSIYNNAETEKNYLALVMKTMLKNKHDEDIYRAGRLLISRSDWHKIIEQNKKIEPFWNEALRAMKKHEQETNFILNPLEKTKVVTRKIENKKPY